MWGRDAYGHDDLSTWPLRDQKEYTTGDYHRGFVTVPGTPTIQEEQVDMGNSAKFERPELIPWNATAEAREALGRGTYSAKVTEKAAFQMKKSNRSPEESLTPHYDQFKWFKERDWKRQTSLQSNHTRWAKRLLPRYSTSTLRTHWFPHVRRQCRLDGKYCLPPGHGHD